MTPSANGPVVNKPDAAGLKAAIEAISGGLPVVLPTDTVYGLAVRAGDEPAVEKLFQLKRRPAERSIAILVGSAEQAEEIAHLGRHEQRIVEQCWPGALTLVLARLESADPSIGREDGTVGVRCPNNPFVRELALAVGPLATTSANLSGEPTPIDAVAAAAALDGDVAVTIDGGPCEGSASTVAQVDANGKVAIFRPGAYTQAHLQQIVRS